MYAEWLPFCRKLYFPFSFINEEIAQKAAVTVCTEANNFVLLFIPFVLLLPLLPIFSCSFFFHRDMLSSLST